MTFKRRSSIFSLVIIKAKEIVVIFSELMLMHLSVKLNQILLYISMLDIYELQLSISIFIPLL